MAKPETTVIFRSKSKSHRIISDGLSIRFVGFMFRTSDSKEIAHLRERAKAPNSIIREIKPEDRVKVTIERSSAPAAANPEDLDIPDGPPPGKAK